MDNKNEIRDELKKLSPLLSKIKKEEVFKVPENYFTSLPDKVLEQTKTAGNTSSQHVRQFAWIERLVENFTMLLRPKYAVGIATITAVIIATVYFFLPPDAQPDGIHQSVTEYVSNNIDEFDAEMLWEAGVSESEESTETGRGKEAESGDFYEEILYELDDSQLEQLL